MLNGTRIVWYRSGKMLQFGGGERVLLEGLRCLGDMGADMRLLLNEPVQSETGAFFARHHAKIAAIEGFSIDDDIPSSTAGGAAPSRSFLRRVRSLQRTMAALQPDLIVAESPVECRYLWVYSLGGRIALPPVVTFIHSSPFQFANDATKYAFAFRRHFDAIRAGDPVYRATIPATPLPMSHATRLWHEADCLALRAGVRMTRLALVLSEKNRQEVERLYGIRRVAVHCPGGFGRAALQAPPAPPAAAPAPFRDGPGPHLLSVCRLIAKKRVDVLVGALAALLRDDPRSGAALVIVGSGPERQPLERLAAALGVEARVRFAGFVPEAELPAYYDAADVFVSADNADYDLSVMSTLPHGRRIVVPTQYDIPGGLASLRRFFTPSEPDPESFAKAIAATLARAPAPLDDGDREELEGLTWERYFEDIAGSLGRAIGRFAVVPRAPDAPHAPAPPPAVPGVPASSSAGNLRSAA